MVDDYLDKCKVEIVTPFTYVNRNIAAYKRSALNVTDANLPQRMNAEIIRIKFGGEFVAHNMRSIARTKAEESGKFRTEVLEAALAHSKKDEIIAANNRVEFLGERKKSCSCGVDS